jgi:hypothetical protein
MNQGTPPNPNQRRQGNERTHFAYFLRRIGKMTLIRHLIVTLTILLLATTASIGTPKESEDYSKRIVGRWLGSRKLRVFHVDGTWGVQRNEEAPEDVRGRRWRISDNKLVLTYPTDNGEGTAEHMTTGVYTIILLTPQKLITEVDGYREEYDWAP